MKSVHMLQKILKEINMTRQELVDSDHLFFQKNSQKSDLLNPAITQQCLIDHLSYIISKGFHIEITAVKSDHSDDADLGYHCHFNGFCADCWPLTGPQAGQYLDQSDPFFQKFLETVASSINNYQIGLTPDAYTESNIKAAGPTLFEDSGDSHVHLGSKQ